MRDVDNLDENSALKDVLKSALLIAVVAIVVQLVVFRHTKTEAKGAMQDQADWQQIGEDIYAITDPVKLVRCYKITTNNDNGSKQVALSCVRSN